MQKTLTFPGKVEDLCGLYIDLKKGLFDVHNVAAANEETYVYLESYEEKDPASIVESWIGKVPPSISNRRATEKRQKALIEASAIQVEKPKPKEPEPEAASEIEPVPVVELGGELEPVEVVDPTLPGERPPGVFRKIWKYIAG